MRAGAAAAAITLVCALGCGGMAHDINQDNAVEAAVNLQRELPPSPERDEVEAMTDEIWLHADTLSTWTTNGFKIEVRRVAKDGEISPAELAKLRAEATDGGFWPADPNFPERAVLLQAKDAEEGLEAVAVADKEAKQFTRWGTVEGITKRGEAIGWRIESCERSSDEYTDEEQCDFDTPDGNEVRVQVITFKDREDLKNYGEYNGEGGYLQVHSGKSALEVRASNNAAAKALIDKLIVPEWRTKRPSLSEFQTALRKHYQTESCSEDMGDPYSSVECDLEWKKGRGSVRLSYDSEEEMLAEPEIDTSDGEVEMDWDAFEIWVYIYDTEAAQQRIDEIRAPSPSEAPPKR